MSPGTVCIARQHVCFVVLFKAVEELFWWLWRIHDDARDHVYTHTRSTVGADDA